MAAKSGLMIKRSSLIRNDLLWIGQGGNSYGQKYFREMNNRLCKVITA